MQPDLSREFQASPSFPSTLGGFIGVIWVVVVLQGPVPFPLKRLIFYSVLTCSL